MHPIYKSIALVLAAVTLPLVLPPTAHAQSMPPGQITFRQYNPVQTTRDLKTANTKPAGAIAGAALPPPPPPGACPSPLVPLWRVGCHSDLQVENFFNETETINAGEQARYLYNAQQSASVLSADLLTTTFQPGLQVVLAGSVTSGSGGGNGGSNIAGSALPRDTTTPSNSSTDSAATTIAKLETGGDFNVRFVLPLLWAAQKKGPASVTGYLTPNVGFTVNGLSAQNTITDSTQYSVNVPLEFYGQLASTSDASTKAVLFLDVKPAGEFISRDLALKLGPSVPTAMFLGEASAGIEFLQKVRVSLQYTYGNASIFQSSNSIASPTGTGVSTPTSRIGGFHLAVSFSK